MASALLDRPVSIRIPAAELQVARTDIDFRNVAPWRVRLSVTVCNVGNAASQSTTMAIQAAPLGAFVPWQDVTMLEVPAIPPHNRRVVTTDLSAPPPTKAIGDFSRVPPRKLIARFADGNERPLGTSWSDPLRQFMLRLLGRDARTETKFDLPDDPFQLLARSPIHWAGNINIHIGRTAVERHLAQALRIYPGKTNLAMFFVGDRRDEYQFALAGSGAAWDATLFDCADNYMLSKAASQASAISLGNWTRMEPRRMILLAICPPEGCETGAVEVQVCQRSTGKQAVVEFSLDTNAAGAGCYTV